MSTKVFTTKKSGSIWLQGELGDAPLYLGCHDVGDVEESRGDPELIRCINAKGDYEVIGETEAPPDAISTDITTYIGEVADYLEDICDYVTLFLNLRASGRADLFTNWKRSYIIDHARISSLTLSGLVHSREDNAAEQSFSISAWPPILKVRELSSSKVTIAAAIEALNAVTFLSKSTDGALPCSGCKYGFVAGDFLEGSVSDVADVLYSSDEGVTWAVTATDPFDAAENISSIKAFELSPGVIRVIVTRGTTDVGTEPAEIAYSDDEGATWTNVDVGSVDNEYVLKSTGLFVLDVNHIWIVTDKGYIYFSGDKGLTWAIQDAGVLADTSLSAIMFVDENVGFAGGQTNDLLATTDGGAVWAHIATPAAQDALHIISLWALDENYIWLGYSDGEIWFTTDGGVTWAIQLTIPGGAINDIAFYGDHFGYAAFKDASGGGMYNTINSGADWVEVSTVTNAGINAMHICNQNLAWFVGEMTDAVADVFKVTG